MSVLQLGMAALAADENLRTVHFLKLRVRGPPLNFQSRPLPICGWRSEMDLKPMASTDPATKDASNSWHHERLHLVFGSFVSLCNITFKALPSNSFSSS